MEMRHLQTFVIAAESQSFTRAAEILGLTQAAISQHVAALEKELRTSLFCRGPKSVTLNDTGRRVYDHAKKILEQRKIYQDECIEEALERAMEFGAFSHGAVRNILKGYPLKEDPLSIKNAQYALSSTARRPLSEYNLLLSEASGGS